MMTLTAYISHPRGLHNTGHISSMANKWYETKSSLLYGQLFLIALTKKLYSEETQIFLENNSDTYQRIKAKKQKWNHNFKSPAQQEQEE